MKPYKRHVLICTNERPEHDPKGSCARRGGNEVREKFKLVFKERGLKGTYRANASGCLDQCKSGCTVVVYPDAVWYGGVTVADVDEIVEKHVLGGEPVARLRIDEP